MKKPILLLCAFLLLIYSVIAFFTLQSLSSAEKTAQYNQLQQKVRDAETLMQFIEGQLQQTQEQLSAITQFLDKNSTDSLTRLVDKTPIIQSVFLIKNRQLAYPVFAEQPSENEQHLNRLLTPFVNDPSLLLQRGKAGEGDRHIAGWYSGLATHTPTLIYWQQSEDYLVGYVLSYTVFRANLIANADRIQLAGHYELWDNGQLLLSNRKQHSPPISDTQTDKRRINVIRSLGYPLQHWTVDYTLPPARVDYAKVILLALILSAIVTLTTVLIYRYTQRRIRLAARQVQFVGQVSHELKTPLTNIRLYAELLGESLPTDEQSARYAKVIGEESQRLTRLIQNVLNFTKSPGARIERIPLHAFLTQLAEAFTPTLQAKGLTIRLNNQCPENTIIDRDKDMLMQILSNFISNAEKYAGEGQYIDIEANSEEKQCTISVRDYGKGIAKNELKHLVKPFYRVHNHLTEGVAGTGIGLTIAKQLADTLGINLTMARCTPGMRFSVVLEQSEQSE